MRADAPPLRISRRQMVNNILGRGLNEGTWLSMPTIGNARQINASYGAADLLVLGTLVWGMFAAVRIVRTYAANLKDVVH